ncbi:hypothetical protein QJ850_gp134 [Acanthamoeba polyphaga mimivirus]|uniref:Uncharacterized protein n=1 Tax=Acanthamoeba polyphaga mimivirus Kroon TaxID=3069720 RepID=A0A0G2Y430_9VIRU|nr:hypothetical protein QJ850_gp134 [Acanthamoeba polyphaga mimivirus]AKI80565.1 hypothetical protein [Acanthamoeba polyphaga mimivirus Kroon]
MELLQKFISQDVNNNLLHYLNFKDNGTKKNITNQLIFLENLFDIPYGNLFLFTKMFDNKVWEIPTNELCEGLVRLFNRLKLSRINELAAGNGLLSARLKYYSEKINTNLKIKTSDGSSKNFGNHEFTYTKVSELDILDFDKSGPIVVSWIHSFFEHELLSCVKKHQNEYIFLVGEHPDSNDYGNNHSIHFHKKMYFFGYQHQLIEFQQVSQMDYYSYDKIRSDIYNENKTCVVLYYKTHLNSKVTNVIDALKQTYPTLFGRFLNKNKKYYDQDKILLEISKNKINEYFSYCHDDLCSLLINRYKNFIGFNLMENDDFDIEISNKKIQLSSIIKMMYYGLKKINLIKPIMSSPIPNCDDEQPLGRIIRHNENKPTTIILDQIQNDKFSRRCGQKGTIGFLVKRQKCEQEQDNKCTSPLISSSLMATRMTTRMTIRYITEHIFTEIMNKKLNINI